MIRDLIKRVLLEYTSDDIEIQIFEVDPILTESLFGILLEGVATIQLPAGLENQIENYLNTEINNDGFGFFGQVIDPKDPTVIKRKRFIIKTTNHYLQRLFRTYEPNYSEDGEDYDPDIVNPGITEGIDLVFDARNRLADYHFNVRNLINLYGLITKYSNGVPMSVITHVKYDKSNKKIYNLELLTQIKGVYMKKPEVNFRIDL